MKLVIAKKLFDAELIATNFANENCIVTVPKDVDYYLSKNMITIVQIAICTNDFYVIETKIESTDRVISLNMNQIKKWIKNLEDSYINNEINKGHRFYLKQNSPLIKY